MHKAKRKHLSHGTPFLLLAFFILCSFEVYSINFFNYTSYKNKDFSCYTDASLQGQHPANNGNCTPLYDSKFSTANHYNYITNGSHLINTTFVYMNFSRSFYSFGNMSFQTIERYKYFRPKSIKVYANGIYTGEFNESQDLSGSSSTRVWEKLNFSGDKFFVSNVPINRLTFKIYGNNTLDDFRVSISELNFTISYVNLSNKLPEVNITSTRVCINGSQYGFVNFNFSAYDPEGDTIYYASNFNQGSNYNQSKKYSKDIFNIFNMFFVEIPDFSFMDQVINTGNTDCNINRDVNNYNSSALNLVNYFWFGIDGFGGGRSPYMLELNSQCSKNNRLLYALPNNLIDVTYETRLFNFNDVNESFNISYYGSDNFLKARRIYYYNSSKDKIFVYNFENSITTKALEIDPVIDNRPLTLHNDLHSETGFKYVGLDYNGVMYQESFEITGTNNNLTWSTTLPYDLATAYAGDYKLRFYVSDSVHYPDEYTTIIKSERVLDCRYDTGSIKNVDSYIGCTGFDPLCFINVLLGKPFKNYMRVIDTDNLGQTIVWWAYIIMFIGLFIGEYLLTKTPDMIIPFFISSICIFFVSLLGGYIQSLTVSLILMAIVLGGLFTNLFKGGANG